MDGQVYVRGNIYATDGVFNGTVYATGGEFKGIVKATDFQTPAGVSMLTKDGKFDSKYLDLGGIVIDGETGNINFTGAGSITWGNNAPVKYQFGGTLNGPWHDVMTANDKYRRDSLDGGTTWGEPYQFKGTDGKNGSNANVTRANIERALRVASTTSESYIGVDSMGSPEIYGGSIYGTNIYAGDGSGSYAHMDGDSLRLYAGDVLQPKVTIDIGWGGKQPKIDLGAGDGSGSQIFSFKKNPTQGTIQYSGSGSTCGLVFNGDGSIFPLGPTYMTGTWDFSGATVKGVVATFG